MYSALNLIFLVSIALSSWLILCYFKQAENKREEDYNMGLKNSLLNEVKIGTCTNDNDIYINFVCISTCIIVLAKIASITEEYILAKISLSRNTKNSAHLAVSSSKNATEINKFIEQHQQLLIQLEDLKKYNSELVNRIRDLEQSNQILQGNDLSNCENFDFKRQQQNIFIANQHFHMGSKDYVNGNFAFIWSKYLHKRNHLNQDENNVLEQEITENEISLLSLNQTFGSEENPSPVIVSTEDLQKMQGID